MKIPRTLVAGVWNTIEISGNYFYFERGTYDIRVDFLPESLSEDISAGQGLPVVEGFTSVRILSATNQSVDVVIQNRRIGFVDNRVVGDVNSSVVPASAVIGDDVENMANTDVIEVVVPSTQRDVIIKNRDTSAGTLWVSEAGAGAVDKGYPLAAGDSLPLNDFVGTVSVYSQLANTMCVFRSVR